MEGRVKELEVALKDAENKSSSSKVHQINLGTSDQ